MTSQSKFTSKFVPLIMLLGYLNPVVSGAANPTQLSAPASPSAQASASTNSSGPELNKNLDPGEVFGEASELFADVVAVQRKALKKADRWLFSPYGSIDFSDDAYTMYGLNLNIGYAPSEFWEIYLNYVPKFITLERGLAKKVREQQAANGQQAIIYSEAAKTAYGIETLWAPAYGKDSWGLLGVVRSDTFFTLYLGNVKYEASNGYKFKTGIGKTFFIADNFNLRMQAAISALQVKTTGSDDKIQLLGLMEAGFVFYF